MTTLPRELSFFFVGIESTSIPDLYDLKIGLWKESYDVTSRTDTIIIIVSNHIHTTCTLEYKYHRSACRRTFGNLRIFVISSKQSQSQPTQRSRFELELLLDTSLYGRFMCK